MTENIAARLREVEVRIEAACERAGRDPADVTLVAVTKTFPLEVVVAAMGAGARHLGENRAQELRDKIAGLGERPGVSWHFIGHLQTNKVRAVAGNVALIHSVDRFGLAEAVAKRARSLGVEQDVLIQVDVGGEASKQGVPPPAAQRLAEEVDALDGIRVRGLMTMPPFPADPEESRPYFVALRELSEVVRGGLPGAVELSMGMTRDYEVAIEEGATIVRVGEAIFGSRAK